MKPHQDDSKPDYPLTFYIMRDLGIEPGENVENSIQVFPSDPLKQELFTMLQVMEQNNLVGQEQMAQNIYELLESEPGVFEDRDFKTFLNIMGFYPHFHHEQPNYDGDEDDVPF